MQHSNALGPTLVHTAHLARARLEVRLSRFDVTPAQTHVLLYLGRHKGEAPQCELIAFLRVKPSTVNGILDRLEEKGMVERSVSGSDARRRLITLTEKGARQQALLRETLELSEERMVAGLSREEQTMLRSLLGRVIRNLEEDEAT